MLSKDSDAPEIVIFPGLVGGGVTELGNTEAADHGDVGRNQRSLTGHEKLNAGGIDEVDADLRGG